MSLLEMLENQKKKNEEIKVGDTVRLEANDRYEDLKVTIHGLLIKKLEQENKISRLDEYELQKVTRSFTLEYIQNNSPHISQNDRNEIVGCLIDEICGYGPITEFLKQTDIEEIMVNGPYQIYVEKKGKGNVLTGKKFRDKEHVLHIIEKIISPLGKRVDETKPYTNARLPDGSRVHIIIPPIAPHGPYVSIRKFETDPFTINDLISFNTLTPEMARFLEACVKARINIMVSGGTSSGKTTVLNCLTSFINRDERILVIEDSMELQPRGNHVLRLEARDANIEGKGEFSIRQAVIEALRMNPTRLIIGEIRGSECFDFLRASNTGHRGSISTAHANSPRDLLYALETMTMMANIDIPLIAIRRYIASTLDLIIQQQHMEDNTRKTVSITEVCGMEGDVIQLQELFRYEQEGVDHNGKVKGRFVCTGVRPAFMNRIKASGVPLPDSIFSQLT
ncbi:MAG: Type II/IV secretion system ATP hydrolase TadA/VirB11/CpaF, TadA subfamily [Firmicutes bacterium]|nr:Type II/IV secretion system ATP hydrolase TadA/VirB11/CpaF, TadA subfamily [Bacillota bacterium]MDI6705610.1 CpaF family protein [Bacillota bacterium]